MALTDEERSLLQEVLEELYRSTPSGFPVVQAFRLGHEEQRSLIDDLVASQHLKVDRDRYALTIKGLLACGTPEAKREVEACDALLLALKDAYRERPGQLWTVDELAARAGRSAAEVAKNLTFLVELAIAGSWNPDPVTGLVRAVQLSESILDTEPIVWPSDESPNNEASLPAGQRSSIGLIEISGYRLFSRFTASFQELTVLIGANGSGKSSLFDLLRLVSFAASNPLPPEIDPRTQGRTLFRAGGPQLIKVALVVDRGQRESLRYDIEIAGPVGSPRVTQERLATTEGNGNGGAAPFVFLDFRGGKGVVHDRTDRGVKRAPWTLDPKELALRRALDPTLVTLSEFQSFVSAWRFYSGFDVSGSALMRRPIPTEPNPTLAEDGGNLSAVLFSLMTEHVDAWQELETHLRSAIPGFQALAVKPRGGPGTVIATWRELGVNGDLTLADLSDGTLRLLCWLTLCLAPTIPPLVCIDEPELGLHPRVLPVLAGMLRVAAARSQVMVATHSPYLLSQFSLDEIAVMKKEDSRAVFARPGDSEALRREIEEVGGDALSQLHISDELEFRS